MSRVVAALNEHEIVPDVIATAPRELAQVTYPNGMQVNLGAELTPRQVQHEPKVEWNADPNAYYTLILSDPDAPSRQDHEMREVLHWLVVNIHGNNLSTGTTIKPYIGSGAPLGTGLHRYVFLVYKQPAGALEFEEATQENNPESRYKFSAANFASKYNLEAVAANLFQAQWDDFVPILFKRVMSGK